MPTATNFDEIKSKVRAMLNLARNDAASEGEIENAMMFANRLMAQYHISEKDLREETAFDFATAKKDILHTWSQGVKLTYWEIQLGNFVSKFIGSVGYYQSTEVKEVRDNNGFLVKDGKGGYKRGQRICFYGLQDEIMLAQEMYDELALIIATLAKIKFGTVLRKDGADYAGGFVIGLNSKLQSAKYLENSAGVGSESRALVCKSNEIVAAKLNEVQQWITKERGMRFKQGAAKNVRQYGNAFDTGRNDGTNFSVSKKSPNKRIGG